MQNLFSYSVMIRKKLIQDSTTSTGFAFKSRWGYFNYLAGDRGTKRIMGGFGFMTPSKNSRIKGRIVTPCITNKFDERMLVRKEQAESMLQDLKQRISGSELEIYQFEVRNLLRKCRGCGEDKFPDKFKSRQAKYCIACKTEKNLPDADLL